MYVRVRDSTASYVCKRFLVYEPNNKHTRTTHPHDTLRRAAPVRMWALHMRVGHGAQDTTTVELNMKSGHNLYLGCEDSPQCAFFFCTFSSPRLAHLLSFYCTLTSLLSLSQCHKPSAAFSTRLRKTRTLQRSNRIVLLVLHCQEAPFFPVLHR